MTNTLRERFMLRDRNHVNPFTPIAPFKIYQISSGSESVVSTHETFAPAADDLLSRSSRSCAWVLEDARGENGRYSKEEVREIVESAAATHKPILIVGAPRERTHPYSDDNWYERFEVEVVPAQFDPRGFIYTSDGSGTESPIDKLISMLDEHQLDPETANYYHPETPYWTVNPCTGIDNPEFNRNEPEDRITNPHYIDGDRIYQVDGVVRFGGNFTTYSYGFSIDTNHAPTIELLQAAINANLARDWEAYNREKENLINTLCDYAGEPRKGEDEAEMINRLLSAVTIVKAESVADYLARYYRQERMTDTLLATYEEGLSRLGFVETSHFDSITGTHIAWPFYATAWAPTQCSEGATGRSHWRIIRHVLNADGSRELEYASTDEKGVLEFVNYEQAEAVAFNLRHPDDHTPASPQSTYGFGSDKSRSRKVKSATTVDFEDI